MVKFIDNKVSKEVKYFTVKSLKESNCLHKATEKALSQIFVTDINIQL